MHHAKNGKYYFSGLLYPCVKKKELSMLTINPISMINQKQNNYNPAFGVKAPIGGAVSLVSYQQLYKSPKDINGLKTFCEYIVDPKCFEQFGFNNVVRACIAVLKDAYHSFAEVETGAKAIAASERFRKTFNFIKKLRAKKWCDQQTVKIEKNLKKGFIFINHLNLSIQMQDRFNVDEVGRILNIINAKKPASEIQDDLSRYLRSMKKDIQKRPKPTPPDGNGKEGLQGSSLVGEKGSIRSRIKQLQGRWAASLESAGDNTSDFMRNYGPELRKHCIDPSVYIELEKAVKDGRKLTRAEWAAVYQGRDIIDEVKRQIQLGSM